MEVPIGTEKIECLMTQSRQLALALVIISLQFRKYRHIQIGPVFLIRAKELYEESHYSTARNYGKKITRHSITWSGQESHFPVDTVRHPYLSWLWKNFWG
jgi:hypothetical protein